MKQTIRLTESELRRMVKRAVNEAVRRPRRNTTRLAESKLRNMIQEAVSDVLNEGGDLFFRNDDGSVYTNSKKTYRGVKGSTFIWHGEWADPEILWKGKLINANDVEDGLWSMYCEECEETGEKPTEDSFEKWLNSLGPSYIESHLDDIYYAMNEEN